MLQLGEFVDVDTMVELADVNGPRGMQCGILVNDLGKITILFQSLNSTGNDKYPNHWDTEEIGVLHYCATSKGQSTSIRKQNLDSRLNRSVNKEIYPIHIFVRYPDKQFRYMGEFSRAHEYDKWIHTSEKDIYSFGLRSKNTEKIQHIIKDLMDYQ